MPTRAPILQKLSPRLRLWRDPGSGRSWLEHVPPRRGRKHYGSRVSDTITDSFHFTHRGATIYIVRESESPEFWRATAYDDERYIWHALGVTMKEAKEGAEKIVDKEIARCQRRSAW
jgi:hypothetical protein